MTTSTVSPTNSIIAARTLARGRKAFNTLCIGIGVYIFLSIAVIAYAFWVIAHPPTRMLLLDVNSNTMLIAPIVDPSSPTNINLMAIWTARAICNRSPIGLDDDPTGLISVLFDIPTAVKVRTAFSLVKQQYIAKQLRSKLDIRHISSQTIKSKVLVRSIVTGQQTETSVIKATVTGQVVVDGVWMGNGTQDIYPIKLDLDLVYNPDLGESARFPLMCTGFSGLEALDAPQQTSTTK